MLRFSCIFVDFVNFFFNFLCFHIVNEQLCRATHHNITFLQIFFYVLVHNHARVNVFTMISFPSLSLIGIAGGTQQPWNYLNDPVSRLTGDTFQVMSVSVFRGGSHQHLALVVHHHPTIILISRWLSQSKTQHGQMDWVLSGAKELLIFWYNDKSQDLSSLVVP